MKKFLPTCALFIFLYSTAGLAADMSFSTTGTAYPEHVTVYRTDSALALPAFANSITAEALAESSVTGYRTEIDARSQALVNMKIMPVLEKNVRGLIFKFRY